MASLLEKRRQLDAVIFAEIARRRQNPDEGDDVMALLLETRDEQGDALSDVEVRDQVVSLIAAGYDTTSAALGWSMYELHARPELLERTSREARAGDASLEQLSRQNVVDWAISETLRLYPPGFIALRYVAKSFQYEAFQIPAGVRVAYSAYVTHRMEDVWSEPTTFKPERWDPSRPDYRAPGPFDFVPFGGGARRCIGYSFALLEMKTLLTLVLRNARLRLVDDRPRTKAGLAAMYAKEGVIVQVEETGA
jgi:cytochrome P450